MSYDFSGGYKIRDQFAPHFLTFTVEGWIDIFTRQKYRDIILNSMQYCRENKGLSIGGYVVMSNHVHVIWSTRNHALSDVVRDFKTFTSKAIIGAINQDIESRRGWMNYMFEFFAKPSDKHRYTKFWTNDNHPEVLYTTKFFLSKLNYIHKNPVRAGYVARPEHYLYSSASNYITGEGIFAVDLMV